MKITSFLGSPRKNGNTAALLDSVLRGAGTHSGIENESFFLHEMNIAPCRGCNSCKKEGSTGCVVKDDMQKVYSAMAASDIIILASPIYWWSVTAQMKTMIDRIYGMDFRCGRKKIALIMTYEGELPNSGPETTEALFREICDYLKMDAAGVLGICTGTMPVSKNTKAQEDGFRFGAGLVK